MIVTPIPGAHRDTVLNLLRSAHTAAINLGNHEGAVDYLERYLTWATGHSRLLGSQILSKDIDALFFTKIYWALLGGAGTVSGQLQHRVVIGLIDQEVRERIAELEEAIQTFTEAEKLWPKSLSVLVMDTSFFIEHEVKFEEADFHALAPETGELRVAVPMVVVDELDRLKEARASTHLRWRARHGLAVLDRLLGGPESLGGVSVEVLPDPPGHVRLPDEDDEIVDQALSLQTRASGPVRLVTYDTGMALRAKIAGMPVRKLRKDPGPEPAPDKK
ncbi:PIN domain-containing protein [Streptomyces gardneri]|uniref:PIN domain-containing protein n=1 Tax=Streptomyces gardneri TaxID=66892 RepID=UPI0035E38CAE